MSRPDLLLVHGAWHGSWVWDPVRQLLVEQGWTVRTVDLPSSGSTLGLQADVDVVCESIATKSTATFVAGHSYGGIVISEACARFENVVGLGYVCAFQLDIGESLGTALPGPPPWLELDVDAGVSRVLKPEVFFSDLATEVATTCAARLRPQSLASFAAVQTRAAWREVPSHFLLCTQDRVIPPAAQEAMSTRADAVDRIASGHSPFLSHRLQVVDFLVTAASAP